MVEQSGIQVVVRLRPMSERELKGNALPVVTASTEKKEVTVIKGTGARTLRNTFAFDNVFTSFSSQKEVFDQTLAPVIDDVLGGYESTVFAYGQTGTGKTHTMEGDIADSAERGVIPRAAFDVFARLADESYVEHSVSASFLEIYNEELCDLLQDVDVEDVAAIKAKSKELRLVEDPSTPKRKGRGVFVMGLTEETVTNPQDVLELMRRAADRRQVGETKMNKQSSRSHCVFTLSVQSKRRLADGSQMECSGKLHMVDLAGSECAKSAGGDAEKDAGRERERKNINQSLLTLGRVITLLKAGGKAKGERIPYRDSKLTRLLQESLGGRCKTCVIATVSPSVMSVDETLSTLQYAQSAHGIINKPTASSMLKLNVDGHSRPSTAVGRDGAPLSGQSQQDWAEMECRMQYLETQAEEAAAALARKHAEQTALVDRAEKAEAEVRRLAPLEQALERQKAETARVGALLKARERVEANLTEEATALIAALDDAAAMNEAAHEALVRRHAAETEKRRKAKAFGAAAEEAVRAMLARASSAAATLRAAHEAARKHADEAADDAKTSAAASNAKLRAMIDGVTASIESQKSDAAHDAASAKARRDKLAAKLKAAGNAASDAAKEGAEKVAAGADAVMTSFRSGEEAIDAFVRATESAVAAARADALDAAEAHAASAAAGESAVAASLSDASAALDAQRTTLLEMRRRVEESAAGRDSDLEALAEEETRAKAASDAAAAAAASAAAAFASEREARAAEAAALEAFAKRAAEMAAAARSAGEKADDAEKASKAAELAAIEEGRRVAESFAALKASTRAGAERDAALASRLSAADADARRLGDAHAEVGERAKRSKGEVGERAAAMKTAFVAALDGLGASAAALEASRPATFAAADAEAAKARAGAERLAADVAGAFGAIAAAVAKAGANEDAASEAVENRIAAEGSKTTAALRDAGDAAAAESDAAATRVEVAGRGVVAATAEAGDALETHVTKALPAALDAILGDVETHVRVVDEAHEVLAPVPPAATLAFSRDVSTTPADEEEVLAGNYPVAKRIGKSNAAAARPAAPTGPAPAAEPEPAATEPAGVAHDAAADAAGAPPAGKKPSMAAMRANFSSKIEKPAAAAAPTRPRPGALKEIN